VIHMAVTIVNVTIPSPVRELDATTTDLQWVVDAYTLVFAALILAAGSLSDRLGRKEVLLVGLGVFGAASLAGAFGQNPGQLIAARAVMGLGAAAIFPSTLSLIANVFTDRSERAKAIGLWGATTGVGVAAGPNWGWGSGATLATIAGGLAILAIFVNVERGMDHPMLDVSLFRNLRFTAASGSITTGFFTLAGFTFLITQYFQFIRGYSAFE